MGDGGGDPVRPSVCDSLLSATDGFWRGRGLGFIALVLEEAEVESHRQFFGMADCELGLRCRLNRSMLLRLLDVEENG